MGELNRQAVSSVLSSVTTGHTQGSFTNGSFAFDEDTLRSLITDWLNLADKYSEAAQTAHSMSRVRGPGEDFASRSHATVANTSGSAYRSSLDHDQVYCLQQAQAFQDALDTYLGVEHRNVTEINKSGPQGPQPGI